MSRSRQGNLPAIMGGSSYSEAFNREPRITPRAEPRAASRIDVLEDRLTMQEKNTASLLDRAYRIKEDIIENLNVTHGSWQEERRARELLQEHIRTITDVVRKLNRDIQTVEEQLRMREGVAEGATTAVKNLEVHHVAGLTDLRGRVARCDASIGRLSTDLKTCYDSIKTLNQQQQDQNSRVVDRLQSLDSRISELLTRIEKVNTEQSLQIKHVEGESTHGLSSLDSKTQSLISDTRSTMNTLKSLEENEREKMESRLVHHMDRGNAVRDGKLDKFEKRVEDSLNSLLRRVSKQEEEQQRDRDRSIAAQQAFESKIQQMMDAGFRRQGEDIARLKRECREGFSTVHESISNMKQVMDGKRKLMEEQLRKEISAIRKMVVLI